LHPARRRAEAANKDTILIDFFIEIEFLLLELMRRTKSFSRCGYSTTKGKRIKKITAIFVRKRQRTANVLLSYTLLGYRKKTSGKKGKRNGYSRVLQYSKKGKRKRHVRVAFLNTV
jgi:hypothetical protein